MAKTPPSGPRNVSLGKAKSEKAIVKSVERIAGQFGKARLLAAAATARTAPVSLSDDEIQVRKVAPNISAGLAFTGGGNGVLLGDVFPADSNDSLILFDENFDGDSVVYGDKDASDSSKELPRASSN